MNSVERLEREILDCLDTVTTKVTGPASPDGKWHLDVSANGRWLVIEWDARDAVGVSEVTNETGYGEGPDQVFPSFVEGRARVRELLGYRPQAERLRDLLERPSLSVSEVADLKVLLTWAEDSVRHLCTHHDSEGRDQRMTVPVSAERHCYTCGTTCD